VVFSQLPFQGDMCRWTHLPLTQPPTLRSSLSQRCESIISALGFTCTEHDEAARCKSDVPIEMKEFFSTPMKSGHGTVVASIRVEIGIT